MYWFSHMMIFVASNQDPIDEMKWLLPTLPFSHLPRPPQGCHCWERSTKYPPYWPTTPPPPPPPPNSPPPSSKSPPVLSLDSTHLPITLWKGLGCLDLQVTTYEASWNTLSTQMEDVINHKYSALVTNGA